MGDTFYGGSTIAPSTTQGEIDMSVSVPFLIYFMSVMCLPGIMIGYGMAYMNSCNDMLDAKLEWPKEK